jgi:hypothetical protein
MLSRRRLLTSAAGGLGLLALPAFARAGSLPGQDDVRSRARALYDALSEQVLLASPMGATGLGLDTGAHAALKSQIDSRTYADRLNVLKPLAEGRAALAQVDAGMLSGRDRSDYDTVEWMAGMAGEIAAFPFGGVDSYMYPCPVCHQPADGPVPVGSRLPRQPAFGRHFG